jgi:ankyrin repeat protein
MITPLTSQAVAGFAPMAISSDGLLDSGTTPINPHPSIIYSLETYGSWEAFTQHHDFVVAKDQYRQILALLQDFIDQYCQHPSPIQGAFTCFLHTLEEGTFTCHEPLLYGEGKKAFEALCLLLSQENLPREKKTSAIYNLAEELASDVKQAMNSLMMITQQLRYATLGILSEALRIREQLIQQFVREFNKNCMDDEERETEHMAVYLKFVKKQDAPPSLPYDNDSRADVLGITPQDLTHCLQYVQARLTSSAVISAMANAYLCEIQQVIPIEGIGLTDEIAQACLSALQTKLMLTYGDVPAVCLLKNRNGRYYACQETKLLQVALMQSLSRQALSPYPPSLLYHYDFPSGESIGWSNQYQSLIQKALMIPQKSVSIYQADSFYWVEMPGDNTPTLLTLAHLTPLIADPRLPFTLIHEAIQNSSVEALINALPLWIQNRSFFKAYIYHSFKDRKKEAIKIILNFFTEDCKHQEIFAPRLINTFKELGLNTPLIRKIVENNYSEQTIFTLLAETLFFLFAQDSLLLIHHEELLCNLLKVGLPIETKDERGNTLLIHAATQGWLLAVEQLRKQGANINVSNTEGQTAVMLAALHGHENVINQLFIAGADLTMTSGLLGNVLAHAVRGRHIPLIEKLLRLRAFHAENQSAFMSGGSVSNPTYFDINARDRQGRTALLWLFETFDQEDGLYKKLTPKECQYITRLLLANGANVYAQTQDNRSVLAYDQVYAMGCFTLLHHAGAPLYGRDTFHILHGAIKHNKLTILRKFMRLKVPVHQPEDWIDGQCPILEALYLDRWQMALLMLSHSQHTLTHHSRAAALEIISNAILDKSVPEKYIIPLLYDTLHPHFITRPDPKGQTFFEHYVHHLTDIVECHDHSLLLQYLQILCTYVNMHLFLKEGDTLLMYLVKNKDSAKEGWQFAFQYLAKHQDLLLIKDHEGFSPFTRALHRGDLSTLKLFWKANSAVLTMPQLETSLTLMRPNPSDYQG